MPSWKKVIISGSNAALNSLTVTNGITGSLFGTASFASTASFLNSTTNAFIQNGNSFGTTALLGTNDNQPLALETNGTTRMFISSSGNIGIGTTTPTALGTNITTLDIKGSSGGGIRSGVSGGSESTFYTIAAGGYLGTISNIPLNLQTNNSVKATILANGNVGINTSAPDTKLHIEDVTKVLTNNVAGVAQGTLSLVSTDAQAANVGASLVFGGNYIDSSETRIAYAAITGRKANSSSVNADGYLSFLTWRSTGLTEAMRITAAGYIGIGTTSPSYPLHVSASVSGTSIYATGDIVAFSDQSVKENIRPIENVLERIGDSRGILYDRIDNGEKDNIGFIAQELEVAFPELVVTNPDGTKAVKYQNAVAVLFEAVKEQQKQINSILKLLDK